MVPNNHTQGSPKSWGDAQVVILGDSQVGNLTFKEIPEDDRPKLRTRGFRWAPLHKLLSMVESEMTENKPDLLVLSIGYCDLIMVGCQHFAESDHQHRVCKINYEFSVKLAADEIFHQWHSWLAKYSCKVLVALTYPIDFEEYNNKKLQRCPECHGLYIAGDEREILVKKIKEWGDLLTERNVPVIYLDEVLKKKNPDYMMNDSVIEEKERALLDGYTVSEDFGKYLYVVMREEVEKVWPDFLFREGDASQEHDMNREKDTSQEHDMNREEDTSQEHGIKIEEDTSQEHGIKIEEDTSQEQDSCHSFAPNPAEPTDDYNNVVLPPKKKKKRDVVF